MLYLFIDFTTSTQKMFTKSNFGYIANSKNVLTFKDKKTNYNELSKVVQNIVKHFITKLVYQFMIPK